MPKTVVGVWKDGYLRVKENSVAVCRLGLMQAFGIKKDVSGSEITLTVTLEKIVRPKAPRGLKTGVKVKIIGGSWLVTKLGTIWTVGKYGVRVGEVHVINDQYPHGWTILASHVEVVK